LASKLPILDLAALSKSYFHSQIASFHSICEINPNLTCAVITVGGIRIQTTRERLFKGLPQNGGAVWNEGETVECPDPPYSEKEFCEESVY